MASSDTAIQRFHDHLSELFGPSDADSLISMFTAADTSNLATKDDVRELRKDVDHQVELLRTEMGQLKHELIGVFRGELITAVSAQTKPLLIAIVSTAVVFAAALLTAVQLG